LKERVAEETDDDFETKEDLKERVAEETDDDFET